MLLVQIVNVLLVVNVWLAVGVVSQPFNLGHNIVINSLLDLLELKIFVGDLELLEILRDHELSLQRVEVLLEDHNVSEALLHVLDLLKLEKQEIFQGFHVEVHVCVADALGHLVPDVVHLRFEVDLVSSQIILLLLESVCVLTHQVLAVVKLQVEFIRCVLHFILGIEHGIFAL